MYDKNGIKFENCVLQCSITKLKKDIHKVKIIKSYYHL